MKEFVEIYSAATLDGRVLEFIQLSLQRLTQTGRANRCCKGKGCGGRRVWRDLGGVDSDCSQNLQVGWANNDRGIAQAAIKKNWRRKYGG